MLTKVVQQIVKIVGYLIIIIPVQKLRKLILELLIWLKQKKNDIKTKFPEKFKYLQTFFYSKMEIFKDKMSVLKLKSTTKDAKKKRGRKKKTTKAQFADIPVKRNRVNPFTFWKYFFYGMVVTLTLVIAPIEIYAWFKQLPSVDLLKTQGNLRSTKIFDRKGRLLYEIYVDKDYNPVKSDQIPLIVKQATIAVEDATFYKHKGIRIDSIIRAAKETFISGNTQGGSTITQQLVKNVLLSPERTFVRKIKEAVLALMVESKYSKDEILVLYLNNIPYGGTSWGIQSASQKYFGKNVWDLDLAEASLLSGLPSSPTSLSPTNDLDLAKLRQKYVLDKMVSLGYITQDAATKAYDEDLKFADQKEYIRAPHFVSFVRAELEKMYGQRAVEFGGLEVTTTLDLDLQDYAQDVVKKEVAKGSYLKFSNGAAVVLNAKTGEILAYVGSIDYFQEKWGSFDVVTAMRQPGSSIKPVTYSLALSNGYTPASIIKDEAVSYPVLNGPAYSPVNYDGRYHGDVTVRQALANSYNIPAVKLAKALGPDKIVGLGKEMGLTNWQVDGSYGLSVTLGGKEVRLLDLANVYATLARQGIYKEYTPFISIKDINGNELYKQDSLQTKRSLSEEVSYLMWNILSDYNARLPAFGVNNYLSIRNKTVAVKTGTTDSKKDNWTLGYTPTYVVGVWVGNNDGSPMNPYLASGLTGAAPIWNNIMTKVLENVPNESPERPKNIVIKKDDKCNKNEYFIKGTKIPDTLCSEKSKDKKKKHD